MLNANEPYLICKKIENYKEAIKLDLNEFDYEHPKELYEILNKSIKEEKGITHYSNFYNNNTVNLLKTLSEYERIQQENILITAGSDDALEYIVNAYVKKNTRVLILVPSYNYFELLVKRKTENIIYISLPISEEILDLNYLLEFYKDSIDVIYIVNPNNPLGTIIPKEHLIEIIQKYKNILFIIDEAYIEFSKENTILPFLADNLIVTRSFSKAYGIAGLRLGYAISTKNIIKKLKVLYNEKNVTELAKVAGNFIITNNNYYNVIISEIDLVKKDFQEFLEILNIFHIKSQANFVSFYVGKHSGTFLKILEENSIYIRDRNNQINMKGFLRITIGTYENILKVKEIIKENLKLFENNPVIKCFTDKNFIWKLKYLFKQVLETFKENNLNYWLDGGSLLGYTRNRGIIPYDNDIDVCIKLSDSELLVNLTESFLNKGLRLKRNRTDCYYQVDYLIDGETNLTNDIHIDIFTLDNDLITTDPRFQIRDPNGHNCNIQYTHELLFPLKKGIFCDLQVNIPNFNGILLASALGKNCITIGKIGENIIDDILDYTCA